MLKSLIAARQCSEGTEKVWTSSWTGGVWALWIDLVVRLRAAQDHLFPLAPKLQSAAQCSAKLSCCLSYQRKYPFQILSRAFCNLVGLCLFSRSGTEATAEMSSSVALTRFSNSNYWYSLINQSSGVCHKSPSVTRRPVINLRTDFAVTQRHPWFPRSTEGDHR